MVVTKYKFKSKIKFLCIQAKVSRSGYYNFLNSEEARSRKESEDLKSKKIVLRAFKRGGYKKGARSIKMNLENDFDIIFNLKKIGRIMKKYGIICPYRKPNPYKNIAKATKEHSTVSNVLSRKFKQEVPRKVLLTDISYLTYGGGKRAYLSTIKDSSTNEILAYEVSHSLSLDIALDTVRRLTRRKFKLHPDCLLHSDQGFHYTSPKFQKLVKRNKITQSMSRRGNCWDNAPMESFFGHMKDEIDLKPLKTIDEVKREITKYMNYYNNHRYQWKLKKMTPVQYRDHLLSA